MSANRPIGASMMAAASKKAEGTQLMESAVREKSREITGKATFTEAPMKGVVKELMVVARRTVGGFRFIIMP